MQFDIKEPDSVNLKKNQENWQKWCKSCPRIVQIWNEFSKNSLILIKISNISFLNWIMTLQNSFLNWITCVVKIWFTRKTFLIRISFLFSSFLNRILTVVRKFWAASPSTFETVVWTMLAGSQWNFQDVWVWYKGKFGT